MKKRKVDYNLKWIIKISIWTFILASIFSIISDKLVEYLNIIPAFIVLLVFIFIGIIFDIIGIAVTSAHERPFHAMAANRVLEAKSAIKLVRNASQVSNFCNDVIGDISGIISGAIGTNIVYSILKVYPNIDGAFISLVITSIIASITVGGKGIGKNIAMVYHEEIIFKIAKIVYFMEKKLGIELFK